MRPPILWKISLAIPPEVEEAAAELLAAVFGQTPSIYTNAESSWATATVYLARRPASQDAKWVELRAGLARLRDRGLLAKSPRPVISRLRREDWAESWKKHFPPLDISSALLIKPGWSRRRPRPGQAVVVLDPGLSFGTGQHATTEFCLRQLAKARRPGARQGFLDIGTGSGILAIAAAKLGYAPVEAFDFDPVAVRVARDNARRNRVGNKLRPARRDLTQLPLRGARRFHVVCANLINDLLIQERRRIVSRLHPDGVLVLAGILATQFPKVAAAFQRAGLRLIESRAKREWRSGAFVFRRHSSGESPARRASR